MKTNKDYTAKFMDYGNITVPKGTKVSHMTALGIDEKYHFVCEFEWVKRQYPEIANILKDDVSIYGINIPKEFIDK